MIPAGHTRLSLVGTLAGLETFDTSFWVLGGTDSLGTLQDLVNGVAGVIKAGTAFSNTRSLIGSNGSYDSVRGYAYTTAGTKATYLAESAIGLAGTGTSTMPNQSAIVVSLRSALVGRSRRGRMYLPANGAVLSATRFLTGPSSQALATEWSALFKAVNSIVLDSGGNPSVVVVSFTLTDSAPVVSVKVDSRPDVQRRRANQQGSGTIGTATVIP